MLRALITAVRRHGRPVSSSRRDAAVLLLHGLTGTPVDVHYMKDALVAEGYTVNAPLLPGRGTRPSDMFNLSWEDWMSSALSSYDELARDHENVVVGGLSAGATMALDIALRRKPSAVILCATALGMGNPIAYLAPYVWRVIREVPSPASDLVDLNAGAKCYDPADPSRPSFSRAPGTRSQWTLVVARSWKRPSRSLVRRSPYRSAPPRKTRDPAFAGQRFRALPLSRVVFLVRVGLDLAFLAFARSGSFLLPVSRFHSSYVSFEISP